MAVEDAALLVAVFVEDELDEPDAVEDAAGGRTPEVLGSALELPESEPLVPLPVLETQNAFCVRFSSVDFLLLRAGGSDSRPRKAMRMSLARLALWWSAFLCRRETRPTCGPLLGPASTTEAEARIAADAAAARRMVEMWI